MLQTLFLVLLAVGAFMDVRSRRIPNVLALAILSVALVASAMQQSAAHSIADALLGVGVALALWFPFWLLGLLGAGDVKYFAGAAAWIGVSLAWRASLLAGLLGGVMSVIFLIYLRGFRKAAGQIAMQVNHPNVMLAGADVGASDAKFRTFPYAVPMAVALAIAVLQPAFLINR